VEEEPLLKWGAQVHTGA